MPILSMGIPLFYHTFPHLSIVYRKSVVICGIFSFLVVNSWIRQGADIPLPWFIWLFTLNNPTLKIQFRVLGDKKTELPAFMKDIARTVMAIITKPCNNYHLNEFVDAGLLGLSVLKLIMVYFSSAFIIIFGSVATFPAPIAGPFIP